MWKWIEHNRWVVIMLATAVILQITAGCLAPQTVSPLDSTRMVNERELALDFKQWQAEIEIEGARFEAAGEDIKAQKEAWGQIKEVIIGLATGETATPQGAILSILGITGLGAVVDNIRKRGVIGGLKRNKRR